jgi:putative acetyltransferase
MNIRPERSRDRGAIHAVHVASFPTAGEADLVDALRAAGRLSVSVVAVESEQVIGHVGFSPVTLDGAPIGLGLAPLAVLPEHRRRGVAERLVRDGLELCRQAGCGLVVLVGEPEYYARFGFRPARGWALRDEYGAGDAFQALELVGGSAPAGGGLVRYAAEFAALGS